MDWPVVIEQSQDGRSLNINDGRVVEWERPFLSIKDTALLHCTSVPLYWLLNATLIGGTST